MRMLFKIVLQLWPPLIIQYHSSKVLLVRIWLFLYLQSLKIWHSSQQNDAIKILKCTYKQDIKAGK